MSRESHSNRLLDGEPTPKFRSVARDIDEDIRTVLCSRLGSQHRIESLTDIVRSKNKTIEKLRQELADVYEMYEKVYEELQKMKFQQRSLNGLRGVTNAERARSLEVKGSTEEPIYFQNGGDRFFSTKKKTETSVMAREDGSLGTTIQARPRSKCSSIDSNSLNLSSIKPQVGQFESSFKHKEMSPQFAKVHAGDDPVKNLKPLLSFLCRRYPEVTDDSQYLPHIRYEFEQLDKNSNFFGVLYRAALELTPEKEAASLSAEPRELWRWLKWFFKQYMVLREQLSDAHRFTIKHHVPPREASVLSKEFEELLELLDAPTVEIARKNLLDLKQDAHLCRQISYKAASIFSIPQTSPIEVLQAMDRLHFTLEKERERSVSAN